MARSTTLWCDGAEIATGRFAARGAQSMSKENSASTAPKPAIELVPTTLRPPLASARRALADPFLIDANVDETILYQIGRASWRVRVYI